MASKPARLSYESDNWQLRSVTTQKQGIVAWSGPVLICIINTFQWIYIVQSQQVAHMPNKKNTQPKRAKSVPVKKMGDHQNILIRLQMRYCTGLLREKD